MNKFPEATQGHTSIPWPEFKGKVLDLYRTTRAPMTTAKVDQVLRQCDALGIESSSQLTNTFVLAYLESLPAELSDWTRKSLLSTLRAICGVAHEFGHLEVNPFTRRRLSRWVNPMPPLETEALSAEQIRRIFDVLDKDVETRMGWAQWRARRLRAVICGAAYLGLRKNELLYLQVPDLDFGARVVRLIPHERPFKSPGSGQPVGMPLALVSILEDWLKHRLDAPFGFPIDPDCPWLFPTINRKRPWVSGHPSTKASTRVRVIGERAGIPKLSFQTFRRSLATHMEALGVGGAMITRQLRHSDERTTQAFYRKADLVNIAAAVRDLVF